MHGLKISPKKGRRDVRQALCEITKEWDELAEALGLPYEEVEVIRKDNPKDVRRCLREVIDKWFEIQVRPSPSWSALCVALKQPLVNRNDIASRIERKYT